MTTNSEQKRLTEKFVGKLVCSTCTFPRLWNYSATTSTEILEKVQLSYFSNDFLIPALVLNLEFDMGHGRGSSFSLLLLNHEGKQGWTVITSEEKWTFVEEEGEE